MAPSTITRVFPVITAAGFSAAVAQIVLLRELMVLFFGIELCVGVILAVWLVWSALGCGPFTRFATRCFPDTASPGLVLTVAAIVLPLTLLLIRASSFLWGIVPGEIPPLAKLLQICLGVTFPFGLLSGLLFGLCWRLAKKTDIAPLAIYVGEALGAAVGGIAFYLLILCNQSSLTIVLVASGTMLLAAAWFFRTGQRTEHLSHFQNVSPPNVGGIFDSSVKGKLSESEIPDSGREQRGNVDHRNTKRISRIKFFTQLRDRRKWGVLKLARPKAYFFPMTAAVLVATGFWYNGTLDGASRRVQWGGDLVAGKDTPYQNLIMLRKDRQFSVFANGLWLFSVPDLPSREYAVHPALLQHPAPESVLLLGGGPAGLPAEIRRHPSVRHIDVVEVDKELADFSRDYLPEKFAGPETGGGVKWHYQDATGFLRTHGPCYDIVLMNMGDPINAQMNRFYTTAFFTAVKNRMAPGGLFSFGVSGGGDMLGEVQIQFLGIIYRTLGQVFSDVLVLPGDQVRFIVANSGTVLVEDPNILSKRLQERKLQLSHVRQDTLRNAFESFRIDYFKSVLKEIPKDQINSNVTPLCYAYALELWTAQWHSRLGRIVASLTQIPPKILWSFFPLACLLAVGTFKAGRFSTTTAVTLSTATVGGLTMVVQIVLLIEFQIMAGALFLHLALIVALFMAGLASGAGWASRKPLPFRGAVNAKKRLVRAQALVCLLPLVLMGLLFLVQRPLQSVMGSTVTAFLFPCLSLFSGILGGFHFAAATATMAELGQPVPSIGGRLYAFDLVGAAGGLLIATFFLIPALGPLGLLPLLSIAAGTSLWTLCWMETNQ